MSVRKNKVLTVRGEIDPDDLGRVLPHEHLSMSFMCTYYPEPDYIKDEVDLSKLSFNLEDLHWIKQYPYCHKPNLYLNECQAEVMDEIVFFKKCGGGTIVDNTTTGIDPDLRYLYDVSTKCDVNIVSGAGYYVACSQTASTLQSSVEFLSDKIRNKVLIGEKVNTSEGSKTIRSGCIGEVGCSWPLHDFEKKSLQASALVQSELGCPVIIHPGREAESPFEIMRIFKEAGGRADKTIMSHLDRTIYDTSVLLDFAKEGCYMEYDLFGVETAFYSPQRSSHNVNDGQRINLIKLLTDEGFQDNITISHDIHTKHRLMKYGGHGYSHIFLNVVGMMLDHGIKQEQIDKFLIHNPKRWLTFEF